MKKKSLISKKSMLLLACLLVTLSSSAIGVWVIDKCGNAVAMRTEFYVNDMEGFEQDAEAIKNSGNC